MKNKVTKFLNVILVTILVFSVVSPVKAGEVPTITLLCEKSEVSAGEEVNIDVNISGSYEKARAFSLEVHFPKSVFESVDITDKDNIRKIVNSQLSGAIVHNFNIDVNDGIISYLARWDKPYSSEINGKIFTIKGKVKKDAKVKDLKFYINPNVERTSYSNSSYETKDFVIKDLSLKVVGNNVSSGNGGSSSGSSSSSSGDSGSSGSSSSSSSGNSGSSGSINSIVIPKEDKEKKVITKELIRKNRKKLKTSKDRLKNTVIMEIGNYAATLNGKLTHIYPNEKVVPFINANSRTIIPVRFVGESLGAKVSWNEKRQEVKIVLGDKEVVMTIGSNKYTINGKVHTMDTKAVIVKDRTMVPIRFVAEALGKFVEWDGKNRLVIITEPDYPWFLNEPLEKKATQDVKKVLSPIVRDIVNAEVKK